MKRYLFGLAAIVLAFGFFDGAKGDSAARADTVPLEQLAIPVAFDEIPLNRCIMVGNPAAQQVCWEVFADAVRDFSKEVAMEGRRSWKPAQSNAAATTINLTNQTWSCNQPLSAYGELPIQVNQVWTQTNTVEFGVRLDAQCQGDADPSTIDLILSSNANGINGPYGDAIRVSNASPGARNLVVTGSADCGRGRAGNHQDGIQAIGGTNITFRDFRMGLNGVDGMPSCNAAGGGVFYSSAGDTLPINMKLEGGEYRGCNVAVRAGGGSGQSGSITDSVFRNGFDPTLGGCRDSSGQQYQQTQTCIFDDDPPITITHTGTTCEKWPNWNTQPPPPPPPPPPPCLEPGCVQLGAPYPKQAAVIPWPKAEVPGLDVFLLVQNAEGQTLASFKTPNDGEFYTTYPKSFSGDRVFRVTSLDGSIFTTRATFHIGQ